MTADNTVRERLKQQALDAQERSVYATTKIAVSDVLIVVAEAEETERLRKLNSVLTDDFNAMLVNCSKQTTRAQALEAQIWEIKGAAIKHGVNDEVATAVAHAVLVARNTT